MHEICEQRKNAILKKILRNAVVTMTMEKMGYLYINSHEDSISGQFAETAKSTNIPSNSGRQAHSSSLEKALEANSKWLSDTLSVLKTGNLDDIYSSVTFEGDDMFGDSQPKLVNKYIRASIIKDNSPDFYDMYTETFNDWNRDRTKTYASIKDYNPRLDEVIRRNNERMTNQYSIVLETLKQNPKFDEFKQKLERFDKPWLGLSGEELMLLGMPKENQNY